MINSAIVTTFNMVRWYEHGKKCKQLFDGVYLYIVAALVGMVTNFRKRLKNNL